MNLKKWVLESTLEINQSKKKKLLSVKDNENLDPDSQTNNESSEYTQSSDQC
ncbi:16715_t:CDS:2, partial [Rhizophagus irregularis]